jgi:predicted transposase/invertase (TIGR01784 family)
MTKLEHPLTNDVLFKLLFVRYPELLKRLAAELLGLDFESISELNIRNPEMPPDYPGDKFCRLDISMTLDGQRINLEIQVQNKGDYPARTLFHWAREYSNSLAEGEPYEKLPRTFVISIVDFKLFDCEEFDSKFRALEVKRHTLLSDNFNIIFFELPKIPESVNAESGLELWLALFKAKTEEDLARIQELEVPIMNQTIEAYRSVAVSPEFQEIERMRSKARHEEAQALIHARREGLQEGLLKGEQKGERKGEYTGVLNVARNALSMALPIDSIMQLTGLSRKEIEDLQRACSQ